MLATKRVLVSILQILQQRNFKVWMRRYHWIRDVGGWFLSCVYICKHCVRNYVWKIYFSTNFLRTRGNWWTNWASSYVKIISKIRKSFREHQREQKFRQTWYPLSCEHPLCPLKKLTGDDSQQTVHERFTNPVLITRILCSRT